MAQLNTLHVIDVPAAMGWAEDDANGAAEAPDAVVDAALDDALGDVPVVGSRVDVAEEEDNHGQWSPAPLDLDSVAGQEIVTQQEDEELLELLRAQVRVAGHDYRVYFPL